MKSPASPRPISRRDLFRFLAVSALGAGLADRLVAAESAPPKNAARSAVYLAPGEGRHGHVGPNEIAFKLTSEHTAGLLGSLELVVMPGILGAPPHHHDSFDEVALVLEGTLHVMVEDVVVAVPAGGWHVRPRGKTHTFWNSGATPARVVELCLPGGHEKYMAALADLFENGTQPAPGALAALAKRFDITFHFDQLKPVMDRYHVHL